MPNKKKKITQDVAVEKISQFRTGAIVSLLDLTDGLLELARHDPAQAADRCRVYGNHILKITQNRSLKAFMEAAKAHAEAGKSQQCLISSGETY